MRPGGLPWSGDVPPVRQGPELLPHPRHQLSHEPEAEEHEAGEHQEHHEIQPRAEADPEYVTLDDGVNAHEYAESHQDRARDTEEEHRLAPEPELEPHGHEIQNAHRDPRNAELRLARAPRVDRHGPRGH